MDAYPRFELSTPRLLYALGGKLCQSAEFSTRDSLFSLAGRSAREVNLFELAFNPRTFYSVEDKVRKKPLVSPSKIFDFSYFQLDEIVARVQATWMSVRYLRNSFVPMNCLLPQVLGLIPPSLRSKWDLINTTTACRYWRNTILSTCHTMLIAPEARDLSVSEYSESASNALGQSHSASD